MLVQEKPNFSKSVGKLGVDIYWLFVYALGALCNEIYSLISMASSGSVATIKPILQIIWIGIEQLNANIPYFIARLADQLNVFWKRISPHLETLYGQFTKIDPKAALMLGALFWIYQMLFMNPIYFFGPQVADIAISGGVVQGTIPLPPNLHDLPLTVPDMPSFTSFISNASIAPLKHLDLLNTSTETPTLPQIQPKDALPHEPIAKHELHNRKDSMIYPCPGTQSTFKTILVNVYTWILRLLSSIYIPAFLRDSIFGIYVWLYQIDMRDYGDCLCQYENLGEFFSRKLLPSARSICLDSPLTSPCDGFITAAGLLDVQGNDPCALDNYLLASVKGIRYKLSNFLGEPCDSNQLSSYTFLDSPLPRYVAYFIIYLSPGDCHRFYSPGNVTINEIRHISGSLFPVSDDNWLFGKIPNVLTMNERVVTLGTWDVPLEFFPSGSPITSGNDLRFSMTMVAATGVGNIVLDVNQKEKFVGSGTEQLFQRITVDKGEELGYFELGSTIVLLVELPTNPSNLVFSVQEKTPIKIGQPLLKLSPEVISLLSDHKEPGVTVNSQNPNNIIVKSDIENQSTMTHNNH
jgi:phosphatidylserine decarboxylase